MTRRWMWRSNTWTLTGRAKSVSLSVGQGEFVSIVGRSGSGKTTLLNVLSTLLSPDNGVLEYQGQNLAGTIWLKSFEFVE